MCGLVGIAGDLSYRDKDVLECMLGFSALYRGRDSTGVAFVHRTEKKTLIAKEVGTPYDLADSKLYDAVTGGTCKAMIGHTRKTTMGSITRENAHPFRAGHLIGVHNGTLRNHWRLPGPTDSLDSRKLYNAMAEVGVRTAIEQTEGAYALVWWDESDETLNFVRNKERTLFYAFSDDYKRVFWASEAWMISIACSKAGVKLANLAAKDDPACFVELLAEDEWWSIKVRPSQKDVIEFVRNDKLEGGVAKPATNFHRPYQSPWDWGLDDDPNDIPSAATPQQNQKEKALQLSPPDTTPTADASPSMSSSPTAGSNASGSGNSQAATLQKKPLLSLVRDSKKSGSEPSSSSASEKFDNDVLDYRGDVIDAGDYAKTDQCCSFCSTDVDYDDAKTGGIGKWLSAQSFLCSTCFNNEANEKVA